MSSDIPTPDEKRSIETSASEEIIGQLDAKLLALGPSDDDAYRKVLRRVDLRIMPLVLLQLIPRFHRLHTQANCVRVRCRYLFMRVDATNISNAAVSLKLTLFSFAQTEACD